jgi:hypothetical protein
MVKLTNSKLIITDLSEIAYAIFKEVATVKIFVEVVTVKIFFKLYWHAGVLR